MRTTASESKIACANRGQKMTKWSVACICCLAISLPLAALAQGDGSTATQSPSEASSTLTVPMESRSKALPGPATEGDNALDLREYPRAEEIFTNALKNAGKNDADRAHLQIGLCEALLNQLKWDQAAKEYKKAQQLVEKGGTNDLRARLFDGLSWLNQSQGNLKDALYNAQVAANIRRGSSGESLYMLVDTLAHIAYINREMGNLLQAAHYYEDALKVQDKLAGPGSMQSAALLERLGNVLQKSGDVNGAKTRFQQALNIKLPTGAVLQQYAPQPYWEDITYRFADGSPNSMRRFEGGAPQLIVTANGVTVAAAVMPQPVETTKATQVNLIVRNDSGRDIQFLPIPPQFILLEPKITQIPQVDPSKLAQTVEKKGDRKAAWIRFWGQNATTTLTSTMIGNGGGFFPYGPYYGGNSWSNRGSNMTIMNTEVPNYAAQAAALQRAAEASETARRNADSIKASGLGPTTLPSGQSLQGCFYFDTKKVTKALLRIPVGRAAFEFEFPAN